MSYLDGNEARVLPVPAVQTKTPSLSDVSSIEHDVPGISKQGPNTFFKPSSASLTTDTESDSGYLSTQSAPVLDQEPITRLSVFSRRPAGKLISEAEKRTMTIETETVANVSSMAGFKNDYHSRSLRTKTSADTVKAANKPKRKKSRVAVTNVNHIPTKSEIFAATITQAVDANDGSDSDETFVYESNPRSPRKLSRSPSISSVHSGLGDRMSSISKMDSIRYSQGLHHHDERDRDKLLRTHAISGKRSMKFANNPYEEEPNSRRHASGTAGRHGNLFDAPNAGKSPKFRPGLERRLTSPSSSGPNTPRLSHPSSPRNTSQRFGTSLKRERKPEASSRPWKALEDEEMSGTSERSPFLRKRSSLYRQRQSREHNIWSGIPFIMAIVCLMFVVLMVGAAALSTSQPLRDVKVVNITNVLVSKQELIFDLVVEAYNPNALAVSVNDVEISVFAQSPFVRDPESSQKNSISSSRTEALSISEIELSKSVHEEHELEQTSVDGRWPPWSPGSGTRDDYPEDEDSTTLLLGRVARLDSTLTFESRFFNRSVSTSRGELRVIKPGNVTEQDGVETWERVIQHSFELIVRGVMKYQTSGLSHVIRSSELYRTAHINPSKVEASE